MWALCWVKVENWNCTTDLPSIHNFGSNTTSRNEWMMRSGSVSLWVGEGKSIYLSDDSNQTVSVSLPLPIPTLETDEIRHTRREFLFSPPSSYEPKKRRGRGERKRDIELPRPL